MKKLFFSLLALVAATAMQAADKVESLTSPNGNLKVEVAFGNELKFSVYDGTTLLLKDSRIGMTVKGGPKVGVSPVLKKKATATVNEQISRLIKISYEYDDMKTVAAMKQLVPEYVSNHSAFSVLDK